MGGWVGGGGESELWLSSSLLTLLGVQLAYSLSRTIVSVTHESISAFF